jgi:hypothetical protein
MLYLLISVLMKVKSQKTVFQLSILEYSCFYYESVKINLNQSFNSVNFHSLDERKSLTEQYFL